MTNRAVIEAFLERRSAISSGFTSNGEALLEYGVSVVAEWRDEGLVVVRRVRSRISQEHFQLVADVFRDHGLSPARWLDDWHVVWEEGGSLGPKEEARYLGKGIWAVLVLDPQQDTFDRVEFRSYGEVWTTRKEVDHLFREGRWAELLRLAQRSRAGQRAWKRTEEQLEQSWQAVRRIIRRLLDSQVESIGPFTIKRYHTWWELEWCRDGRRRVISQGGAREDFKHPSPALQLKVYREFLELWEELPEKERLVAMLGG